jgi:uncharacterized membrane protein
MDIEERVRSLENAISEIRLRHKQNVRLTWIIVGCILVAPFTVGIGLLVMIPLLIWHFNQQKKELIELAACGSDTGHAASESHISPAGVQKTLTYQQPSTTTKPPVQRFDFELWVARPLFLTLGTLALLTAAAYFVSYTSSAKILAPVVRLSVIIIAGIVLLFVGDREFRRIPSFGYAILGGGFGLLLISIYGVLIGYKTVPYTLVFAFLLVITLSMTFLAARHKAWPLAALGLTGGFFGPAWIGFQLYDAKINVGDYSTVAVYIMILVFAAFLLSVVRNWQFLPFLSLFFSYSVLGGLYVDVQPVVRLTAICSVFLLLLLSPLYRCFRYKVAATPEEIAILILNCAFFTTFGVENIYRGEPVVQGMIGMSAAFLLALLASFMSASGVRKRLMESLCGLAVVFIAVSLIFLLEANLESIGLTLVAILTVWLAKRFESGILRTVGLLEMLWAVGKVIFIDLWSDEFHRYPYEVQSTTLPYINGAFAINFAVIAGAFLVLYIWSRAIENKKSANESSAISAGIVIANLGLVVLLQREAEYVNNLALSSADLLQSAVSAASYLLHGGILTFLGLKRNSTLLRGSGLVLFIWTVLWVIFEFVISGPAITRVVTLSLLGLAMIIASFWYYRRFQEVRE